MWKHYTSRGEKIGHGFLIAISILNIIFSIIAGSIPSWSNTVIFLLFTFSTILLDIWHGAYVKTERMRAMGAGIAKALDEYAFIRVTASNGIYYIEPDKPEEDPDDEGDDIFTDEIVIRCGINNEGEHVVSYRVPRNMGLNGALSAIETVKAKYVHDELSGKFDE